MLFLVAPVLRVVGLALFRILHTHNLHYPVPTGENELFVVHFTFLLQDFRFRYRKHMISVTLRERFHRIFRMRESAQRFIVSPNLLMF